MVSMMTIRPSLLSAYEQNSQIDPETTFPESALWPSGCTLTVDLRVGRSRRPDAPRLPSRADGLDRLREHAPEEPAAITQMDGGEYDSEPPPARPDALTDHRPGRVRVQREVVRERQHQGHGKPRAR